MADAQYDLSPKMQELFKKKEEQRQAAKSFWRKQVYNPYNPTQPFDPVLFRYTALSAYSTTYYKINYQRTKSFLFFLLPFFLTGWVVNNERTRREYQYRSGNVSYEDRDCKLVF